MRVLIVTVGLSAITNEGIGTSGMSSNITLRGEVKRYFESNRKDPKYWGDLLDMLVDAHKNFWQQGPAHIADPAKRRQTSAELISTHLLLREFKPDEIYLLSSDTDPGRLAAKVNYRVMEDIWGYRVRAERIDGLDEEMKGISARLLDCFNSYMRLNVVGPGGTPAANTGQQVVCNITGGYKGTLPELALIAQANSWRLFYLHENGSAAWIALDPKGLPETTVVQIPDRDRISKL